MKKKTSLDKPISVFDLSGLRVLIADSVNEVPLDVRFAAQEIVHVQPPTADHIRAARRVLGRSPLSDESVQFLVGKPQNVIVAAIHRTSVELTEVQALVKSASPETLKLELFELPGFDELKSWAKSVQTDVERWRRGELFWKDVSRGALLSGPPGTGKTLFASALAGCLGFKLLTTTVGAWQSAGYLNDMLSEMRKSFDEANSGEGVVLLIDEFDSIGTRPVRPIGGSDQYWQVVINEFLNQMNGVRNGVLVIGATNHPEWIDPAILRSGRIERHFVLSLPDKMTRAEILRYHLGDALPIESLLKVADDLEGKSAASLEEIARNARKLARDESRDIELRDLEAMLPEKLAYTLKQQFQLAVHEAGHALVALSVGYAASATIEIREAFDPNAGSHFGGRTTYKMNEDHFPTESGLLDRIAVCLAGMAAESVVFDNRSIGSGGVAGSDVERATAIARRMVGSYGLGKSPVFVTNVELIGSQRLPCRLESEVIEILKTQYERTIAILNSEKARLIELASDVVNNRTVRIERGSDTDAA
ncbi:AAA family ATPase [Rhizobium laguerreae]|uniref:AAA family ATPase n=1 Tax=Rhizobium laguerreae TaxID=1076926 RepID=UPI001C908833|nr:AAA family ATPase [Rhizobium laguerreae]MBY3201775.1 AAA family ATPase [Rhizobium laguerreae]